ncbi:MAG: hypothetical protein KBD76_09900 [Bacteriovorax sp.]|nr:hypothetical protein [Bacteriovorax sp.]
MRRKNNLKLKSFNLVFLVFSFFSYDLSAMKEDKINFSNILKNQYVFIAKEFLKNNNNKSKEKIALKFKEHCKGSGSNGTQSYFYLDCNNGLESVKKVLEYAVNNGNFKKNGMTFECTANITSPKNFNSTENHMGMVVSRVTTIPNAPSNNVKIAFSLPPSEGFKGVLSEEEVAKLIENGKGEIKSFFPDF